MTKRDWLLVAISAADRDGLDPVQLQKSLFLLGEKGRPFVGRDFYQFVPHNYGPFSAEIYADADLLEASGYIVRQRRPWRSWSTFTITDAGHTRAATLAAEVAPEG